MSVLWWSIGFWTCWLIFVLPRNNEIARLRRLLTRAIQAGQDIDARSHRYTGGGFGHGM